MACEGVRRASNCSLYCRMRGYTNGKMVGSMQTVYNTCVMVAGGPYNIQYHHNGWGRFRRVWCERKGAPVLRLVSP